MEPSRKRTFSELGWSIQNALYAWVPSYKAKFDLVVPPIIDNVHVHTLKRHLERAQEVQLQLETDCRALRYWEADYYKYTSGDPCLRDIHYYLCQYSDSNRQLVHFLAEVVTSKKSSLHPLRGSRLTPDEANSLKHVEVYRRRYFFTHDTIDSFIHYKMADQMQYWLQCSPNTTGSSTCEPRPYREEWSPSRLHNFGYFRGINDEELPDSDDA
jgi:hypothetical protein